MAYDKVVNSSVLNAGLTKIADAIRAKGGTSGQPAFPDGLAAAIEAIEAGGGGLDFEELVKEANCGTFTPAGDIISNFPVNHGLSSIPQFIVVWRAGTSCGGDGWTTLVYRMAGSSPGATVIGTYNPKYNKVSTATGTDAFADIGSQLFQIACTTTKKLISGAQYNWLACK